MDILKAFKAFWNVHKIYWRIWKKLGWIQTRILNSVNINELNVDINLSYKLFEGKNHKFRRGISRNSSINVIDETKLDPWPNFQGIFSHLLEEIEIPDDGK